MASMGNSKLVGNSAGNDRRPSVGNRQRGSQPFPSLGRLPKAPNGQQIAPHFYKFVTCSLQTSHLSESQAEQIAQFCWRKSSQISLNRAAKDWYEFCKLTHHRGSDLSFDTVMTFFEHLAIRKDLVHSRLVRA